MHEFVKRSNVQTPPLVKLRYSPRDVSFFRPAGASWSDEEILAAVARQDGWLFTSPCF
jgi:hypothetical protein